MCFVLLSALYNASCGAAHPPAWRGARGLWGVAGVAIGGLYNTHGPVLLMVHHQRPCISDCCCYPRHGVRRSMQEFAGPTFRTYTAPLNLCWVWRRGRLAQQVADWTRLQQLEGPDLARACILDTRRAECG